MNKYFLRCLPFTCLCLLGGVNFGCSVLKSGDYRHVSSRNVNEFYNDTLNGCRIRHFEYDKTKEPLNGDFMIRYKGGRLRQVQLENGVINGTQALILKGDTTLREEFKMGLQNGISSKYTELLDSTGSVSSIEESHISFVNGVPHGHSFKISDGDTSRSWTYENGVKSGVESIYLSSLSSEIKLSYQFEPNMNRPKVPEVEHNLESYIFLGGVEIVTDYNSDLWFFLEGLVGQQSKCSGREMIYVEYGARRFLVLYYDDLMIDVIDM